MLSVWHCRPQSNTYTHTLCHTAAGNRIIAKQNSFTFEVESRVKQNSTAVVQEAEVVGVQSLRKTNDKMYTCTMYISNTCNLYTPHISLKPNSLKPKFTPDHTLPWKRLKMLKLAIITSLKGPGLLLVTDRLFTTVLIAGGRRTTETENIARVYCWVAQWTVVMWQWRQSNPDLNSHTFCRSVSEPVIEELWEITLLIGLHHGDWGWLFAVKRAFQSVYLSTGCEPNLPMNTSGSHNHISKGACCPPLASLFHYLVIPESSAHELWRALTYLSPRPTTSIHYLSVTSA